MIDKGIWKEIWQPVEFDFEFTNDFRLEVSNWGRVRSFSLLHKEGNILKGSVTNGYKVIRLKLYKPRATADEQYFDDLKSEISALFKLKNEQLKNKEPLSKVEETLKTIAEKKQRLSKLMQANLKKRTINHHFMVHRLVAQYFLPNPEKNQTLVAHLDHDKFNNRLTNLKWMSLEENLAHQAHSPHVIAERKERKFKKVDKKKHAKLSVTRVMLLKKLLAQNKSIRQLAKQFKVSDTQILRIKRGENWAELEAAK